MSQIKSSKPKPPSWKTIDGTRVHLAHFGGAVCWVAKINEKRTQMGPKHRGLSEAFAYGISLGWKWGD